jgi:hypothetical protein
MKGRIAFEILEIRKKDNIKRDRNVMQWNIVDWSHLAQNDKNIGLLYRN